MFLVQAMHKFKFPAQWNKACCVVEGGPHLSVQLQRLYRFPPQPSVMEGNGVKNKFNLLLAFSYPHLCVWMTHLSMLLHFC